MSLKYTFLKIKNSAKFDKVTLEKCLKILYNKAIKLMHQNIKFGAFFLIKISGNYLEIRGYIK